jgi:CrcB protein
MISFWLFAAICVAGGLGAALRFTVDAVITARVTVPFPIATTVINVTGSFVLGVLTGAAASAGLPSEWLLIGGGGLMGGYTTFSTASVETVRLVQRRRYLAAAANGTGMVVLAVGAAALGVLLGAAL